MLTWSTAAPALGAAFLASTVEVVEAFTIVLAVATLRGWRPAALGAGAALALLAAAVLLLGPLLGSVPIHALSAVNLFGAAKYWSTNGATVSATHAFFTKPVMNCTSAPRTSTSRAHTRAVFVCGRNVIARTIGPATS